MKVLLTFYGENLTGLDSSPEVIAHTFDDVGRVRRGGRGGRRADRVRRAREPAVGDDDPGPGRRAAT